MSSQAIPNFGGKNVKSLFLFKKSLWTDKKIVFDKNQHA
jgi:hypothetical protein